MAVDLPLFPLGTVLFPHMPLALHIFEERYRQMMRDCQEAGTSFGVVAIREGREVGEGAVPYEVGTLAQIRESEPLPDGRYNLRVEGASRFRVDRFSHELAYLHGSIRYLQESTTSPDAAAQLAETLAVQVRRYLAAQSAQRGGGEDVELPADPELLSYFVAASLNVETARRQELLEIDLTEERIRACITLLRREQSLLDRMLARRDPVTAVSPN